MRPLKRVIVALPADWSSHHTL